MSLDEKKAKDEEKKVQAKINREERKIALKEKYTDKKIAHHVEKAIKKIYEIQDDAEADIIKLLNSVDSEIEAGEKPIEFILFKANNELAEIVLKAQLKMQKVKTKLIKSFEKDFENIAELVSLEEDLAEFKDEMDEVSTLLDEKVEIEKETLNLNS